MSGDASGGVVHKGGIPQQVLETVARRRGRLHPFEDLEPARTALVVIDMQNAFVRPGFGHAFCANAVRIIPNINRLAAALRARGGRVVWIRTTHSENCPRQWSVLYEYIIPNTAAARAGSIALGTQGHELTDGLEIDPADQIVEKYRYSAFLPESSDLRERLVADGRDTVIIAGTVTNICCESSARDAMMMNFKTMMVSDANAAQDDASHWAALTSFYTAFGDVMSTDEIVRRF